MINIFSSDFIPYGEIQASTIEKYRGKVPIDLLNIWDKFGKGSIKNGYLKLIDPDDFVVL
ncbi:GAD-like domain-containing protein [Paenibacillus sp. FSL R7-0297]|uniref:GAD-like domain-containing protein n=1 Tax=Paenibacillus sp. FSL R7-0297 TaxID=2921680 RepID=UPI0030F62492